MKLVNLDHKDTIRLSELYADAFGKDTSLMKTYNLKPRDLAGFFRVLHGLFLSGKPVKIIGLEDNGTLLSATTLIGSDFMAGPRPLLSAAVASAGELGPTRATWFWLINIYQGILSAPRKPCWRLLFIGTRTDCAGKGLGGTLLDETCKVLPGERIQLEVEAVNPAGRLYERKGFREERRFRLRGVEWRVMVRL
ncbi:MAG: GNAT family N-acetyltransferase [candidate division WOR-3 bacterium]